MPVIPLVIERTGRGEMSYDIYSRLLKDRIVFLGTAIDDQVANAVIAQLLFLQMEGRKQDISLYINSPGGSVSAGMAIYDTLQFISCDVATYCIGQAASMGAVLVAAGTKGKRYSLPHSRLMMHQPWGRMGGTAADIAVHAKELLRIKAELFTILSDHTGRDRDQIIEDCDRDFFLDANEAKEYGLIDEVVSSLKSQDDDSASLALFPACGEHHMPRRTQPSRRGGDGGGGVESCTFCGRGRTQVNHLISGPPNIYICDECVELCNSILAEQTRRTGRGRTGGLQLSLDSLPKPVELKDKLDQYVIGQERAKKVLSVAVHNHYKRILSRDDLTSDVSLDKSNVLLIGPTGCGKTLLASTLARLLDVPFAIGDATTLTEAGYVGEDVENLLLKLMQAADFDVERAQRGILFIDEIDKIGRTTQNVSITRDVSGEGVQQALLKMLEGTVANIPPQGGRKHPEQSYIQLDTRDILFICGGTFVGLEQIIARRVGKRKIGFLDGDIDQSALGELLAAVEVEDLIGYGMIPELLGRLPIHTSLMPLTAEDLTRIMVEPRNAIIRQFQKFFEMEDKELAMTDGALKALAEKAIAKDTGARAIRAIVEELMLEIMYEMPSRDDIRKVVIDEDMATADEAPQLPPLAATKKGRKKKGGERQSA